MSETILTDDRHRRSDALMIATAIRKGWNIPDVLLDRLPSVAGTIALDPESTKREKCAAMELLRKFKADNDAQDTRQHEHQHQHVHAVIPIPQLETTDSKRAEASRLLARLR